MITCFIPYYAHAIEISEFQPQAVQSAIALVKKIEKNLKENIIQESVSEFPAINIASEQSAQEIKSEFDELSRKDFFTKSDPMGNTTFYIFVSSSLPRRVLRHLAAESRRYGGILVLQGLIKNSVRETVGYLSRLINQEGEGIIIDPTLFKRYRIDTVPTFVLSEEGGKYDIIKGAITPKYALSQFSKSGDLRHHATERLKK